MINLVDSLLNPDKLFETSLSRVLKHWNNSEFVLITAWRQDKNGSDNVANFRQLKSQIKGLGYGFVQVEGYGQEETGVSKEPTLLVINNRRDSGFLPSMLKLATRYEQYGLAHARGDGTGAVLRSDGSVDVEFSSVKMAAAEFFTSLSKRRPESYTRKGIDATPERSFHFEGIRRVFPKSVIEGMAAQALGEGIPD